MTQAVSMCFPRERKQKLSKEIHVETMPLGLEQRDAVVQLIMKYHKVFAVR